MSATSTVHDVIVVGSGPAGYTAAIYTARAQLKPLVFEGTTFGGALMTTTEVENYPGFRSGITGPELMDEMREQALRFGADLRMDDVEAVSLDGPVKEVVTSDGEKHLARAVILAMGAAARYLGVPGEQELLGRGVSACATCDGFFFKDQDIAVIGGGDSAMEEATFLTRFARSVTLVHRREEFRASRIMLERARDNDKITFLTNTAVIAVEGETSVTGLRVRDLVTGEESKLLGHGLSTCATCDGFFFRDHDIAVVGGGDSAVEEALFLTKFAKTVTLVHRRDELRASKIMQERAFANEKIRFAWNSTVVGITGEQTVESITLEDTVTGERRDLPVTGVFVAIGHKPNTDLFKGQLQLAENGYLVTHNGSHTDVEGVFACGDVQDDIYRQAITAAGSGCMAAIDTERWLEAQGAH